MNYNNYPSVSIDKKVKMIQNFLAEKTNFTNVNYFGRIEKGLADDGKSFNVATVQISEREYLKDVFINDSKSPGGSVFFIEEQLERTTKNAIVYSSKIKVVFMLNLEKCFAEGKYLNRSQVQALCVELLNKSRFMTITGVQLVIDDILNGFDTSKIKKLNTLPYCTFSVNGTVTFDNNTKCH